MRLIAWLLILLLSSSPAWAARGFGTTEGTASTDGITLAYTTHPTSASWSIWVYRTGDGGASFGRIFGKGEGTGGVRFFDNTVGAGTWLLTIPWSGTEGQWSIASLSNSTWHHILITYDGSSTTNDPIIYVDGSSVTVTETATPVGTLTTNADGYRIGNRSDATRNWNGRLAEFAFWDSTILTAGNATSLWNGGSGAAATEVSTPTSYLKLCGTTSPEPNEIGGVASGTVTGALEKTHPFSNCTVASGLSGSLSLLGVGR